MRWDPFTTLQRALWIGGGQWAGKSTVAGILAEQYGLTHYHYDYHDARGHEVGQPSRRGRDQLEMKLRQVRPWPAHLGDPLGDSLLAVGGERVHLAIRPVGAIGRPLDRQQASPFQPGQRDVDLPSVHRVTQRAERVAQPRAQLVAVRRLLGQHRQHHFLPHRPSYITVSRYV